MRRRPLTRAAAIASATLIASGGALLAAGAAVAAPAPSSGETIVAVAPDATTYAGWHEGYADSADAHEVRWNGLHLGLNGKPSQVINGLSTPQPVTGAQLSQLIVDSTISVVEGNVFLQVPVFYGPDSEARGFTTLRPASGAGVGASAYTADQLWVSSRALGEIAANTPVALSDLVAALDAVDPATDDIDLLAYGVLAEAAAPSVVASVQWAGHVSTFTSIPSAPLPVTPATVLQADIQALPPISDIEDLAAFRGWYQAAPEVLAAINAAGLVEIPDAGDLEAGGLVYFSGEQTIDGARLGQALRDLTLGVEQGEVSFFAIGGVEGEQFSLFIERELPFGVAAAPVTLDEIWTINETDYPLGELIEVLQGGEFTLSAFGVLNESTGVAALRSITFNGVAYTFAQVAPVAPGVTLAAVAGPQLAATGSEATGIALGAGLLAAGALLLMARGSRRVRAQG